MADKKAEKVKDDDNITQIYDKIFKRILTLSNLAVIGFINGIFGKNFPKDSKLTYNWTENVKTDLERTIADTIITVNNTEKFHTEVQISNDNTIVLRVFDYGYQDALKYRKTENDRIILEFPQSKIIFLEHNVNTPDEVVLQLDFKDQGIFEYRVPAMKFLEQSIEDLNKQRLVILLPLYLLKLRREIEKEQSIENALKLKNLINDGIIKSIEDNEKAGNITHEDTIVLIKLLERLYTYLYGKIKEFKQEGVKDIMTEKLIFDVDIIMHERDKAIHERDKLISESQKLEEKKALEIAQNMINEGMKIEQIKNLTKLPLNKIKGLKKQMKK